MTQRAKIDQDGPERAGGAIDAGAELDPVHPMRPPAPRFKPGGLTTAEVAERVARGDVNDVPVRSSRSTVDIVRANVFTRFNAIIGVLWVIMLIVAPIQDSLFGFVIIANTGIGIIQEMRAKKTLDGLAVIGEAKPSVRRDGRTGEISTSEIVLGDVIELGPGDKVVVDGSVGEADGLEIDESLLTGEADPVLKKPGDLVMSGSFVVAGGGAFTATKVGREAYAAQLAEEASRFTLVHSELRSGISTILKYVTWMMIPTSIGLIISQLVVKENNLNDAIARTVGGIVPMIPEGLVLLTSVAFAIGVIRLGRQQCLVQELPAIEGLARVDVVCLDKTGTLTEGGMDVTELRPLGGADPAYVKRVLGALGESDPRPNASLQAIIDAYPDSAEWRCTESLPFSSARKYSGASFSEGDGENNTWLLGAPDILLPPGTPPSTRSTTSTSRACGSSCWPDPPANWTTPPWPPGSGRPPSSSSSSGCGPTPPTRCATSRTRTSRRRSSPATTPSPWARSPASWACRAPRTPSTPASSPPSRPAWRRSSTPTPSSGA